MQIGRSDLHAAIQQGEQIVGDHTLNRVFVAKLESNPQSIQLWPGQKRLALGLEIIGKFAHKINAADILHLKAPLLPFGRQQLKCLGSTEFAGVQVPAQDVAIEESHDDFLVRGGWCSCFHESGPAARALRVERNYVMLSDLLLSSAYFSKA